MTASLIEGRLLASQIRQEIAKKILLRKEQGLRAPGLAVVIVGNNPASKVYVDNKRKAAEEVGMHSRLIELPENCTQTELLTVIDQLNQDSLIDGFLVQLPLPGHIDKILVIDRIAPHKDIDGFHPLNVGLLCQNRALLRPCTPKGIMRILEHIHYPISGAHAVIVGTSHIVGRPLAQELLNAKATVTLCHQKTRDLAFHTQQADILISATGVPGLIGKYHIKPGAVVIDVGTVRLPSGALVGDVQFDEAISIASFITPVPGGVGPLTIAMLLENTLIAAMSTEPSI
jgi:methylenetetrahydrofolate dehydrogenase (NADP+) / methenyltetrahydrofolate cyclohydrolase